LKMRNGHLLPLDAASNRPSLTLAQGAFARVPLGGGA
jgi:hypothetical protein